MDIYRFDQEVGKPINAFGSHFKMSRIGAYAGEFHIGCMHLEANGLVGRHDAVTDQLFLVIEGEGWVSGASGEKISIRSGEAAFWVKGESHEAGTTNQTMKAMVIEAEKLNPESFMAKKG
jgi:quercetin dioxygenase-like cupin family protein